MFTMTMKKCIVLFKKSIFLMGDLCFFFQIESIFIGILYKEAILNLFKLDLKTSIRNTFASALFLSQFLFSFGFFFRQFYLFSESSSFFKLHRKLFGLGSGLINLLVFLQFLLDWWLFLNILVDFNRTFFSYY